MERFQISTITLIIGLVVIGGAIYARAASTQSPKAQLKVKASCPTIKQIIVINISDDAVTPQITRAHLCDQIAFTSIGSNSHVVSFGPHLKHIDYPGLSEQILLPGHVQMLKLVTKGTFSIHDHIYDSITGSLVIN